MQPKSHSIEELIELLGKGDRSYVIEAAKHPNPQAGELLTELIITTPDHYIRSRGVWWLQERENFDVVGTLLERLSVAETEEKLRILKAIRSLRIPDNRIIAPLIHVLNDDDN
jgi:hypothetical protein